MTWTPDIQTDAVTENELEVLSGEAATCNGFAFNYLEAHDDHDVVVKDAIVGNSEHCYVYDATLGVTIDPTLGQFEGKPSAGAWDGDVHPHVEDEEVYEWGAREDFEAHYDAPNSPFIL